MARHGRDPPGLTGPRADARSQESSKSPGLLDAGDPPPALLLAGEGADTDLSRVLELDPDIAEGVLHISATAASCDIPSESGAGEYPARHVHQQDRGVPVRLTAEGTGRLVLVLAGMEDQMP